MSIEEELAPVVKFLRGRVLNAGCGDRDINDFLRTHGTRSVENCDLVDYSLSKFFQCDLTDLQAALSRRPF